MLGLALGILKHTLWIIKGISSAGFPSTFVEGGYVVPPDMTVHSMPF